MVTATVEVSTSAKLVSKTDPIYPNLSGRDRVTGVAILKGTITPAGCVQQIHTIQSSGVLSIDIASMLGFLQWRYEPAKLNREAIATPLTVTFTPEGRFQGTGGINRFNGSYRVEGNVIEFGPAMSTRMAGPNDVMRQVCAAVVADDTASSTMAGVANATFACTSPVAGL